MTKWRKMVRCQKCDSYGPPDPGTGLPIHAVCRSGSAHALTYAQSYVQAKNPYQGKIFLVGYDGSKQEISEKAKEGDFMLSLGPDRLDVLVTGTWVHVQVVPPELKARIKEEMNECSCGNRLPHDRRCWGTDAWDNTPGTDQEF